MSVFCLLYRPGGQNGPFFFFRKGPGNTVKASGRLFTLAKSKRPRGR